MQRWLDDLLTDLRHSFRLLRRTPGFVLAALLLLALGIGANTALFTVVRSVLLQPPPYVEPDQLGLLRISVGELERVASLSAPELEDFRERASLLEGIEAQWTGWGVLRLDDETERIRSGWITAGLFPLLGTGPALGRTFTAAEEDPEGPNQVTILSHQLWQRAFGGDPGALGTEIDLDGVQRTVVGIMPEDFRVMLSPSATNGGGADLWIPNTYWVERDVHWLRAVVRRSEGVTWEQAQSEIDAITERLNAEHPEYADSPVSFHVDPLTEELVAAVRPALMALGVAVTLVLLMACANVAALALARAQGRAGEIRLRTALGASRSRLARQVLTEHLVLGLLAGALGVFLARVALEVLIAARPESLPRVDEIRLDGGMVGLALALTLAALALVGSAPAWRVSRGASGFARTEGGRALGVGGERARRSLVAVQVAAALALAIATGLLLRSLQLAYESDLGFEHEGVTVARLNVPFDVYDDARQRIELVRLLEQALLAQPEIDAVGTTNLAPVVGGLQTAHFETDAGPGGFEVDLRLATPGYLSTLSVSLVEGRGFDAADIDQQRPVAVIDRRLADRLWPGERAVGRRLKTGLGPELVWHEIVGVTEEVAYNGVRGPSRAVVHLPYQGETPLTLVVASTTPTTRTAELLRGQLRAIDPGVPVSDIRPLSSHVADDVADLTFALGLMGVFTGIALLLALVGTYGVIAHWVRGSTHALAVRIALGAERLDVVGLVVRQGMAPAAVGALLGLAGALGLARLIQSLLFGVAETDWRTYALVTVALLCAVLVASLGPGLSASRVEPSQALRSE